MEKKPVNFVVHNAEEAAKRLNELVEKGYHNFDIGVNHEYVTTVSVKPDGSKSESKEDVYRIIGFADVFMNEELDSLNAVRDELKEVKKERQEMNRTLNIMNKSSFAPISIFLLIVAIITLVLGVLTLANILPLAASQKAISVVLTIVGVLALAGSIACAIVRSGKKKALLAKKDEVLKGEDALKAKEKAIDARTPAWYKESLWSANGSTFKNASNTHTIKK